MSHPDSHLEVERDLDENTKLLLELRDRFQQSQKEDEERASLLSNLEGAEVLKPNEEGRKLPPHFNRNRRHWIPI